MQPGARLILAKIRIISEWVYYFGGWPGLINQKEDSVVRKLEDKI